MDSYILAKLKEDGTENEKAFCRNVSIADAYDVYYAGLCP